MTEDNQDSTTSSSNRTIAHFANQEKLSVEDLLAAMFRLAKVLGVESSRIQAGQGIRSNMLLSDIRDVESALRCYEMSRSASDAVKTAIGLENSREV